MVERLRVLFIFHVGGFWKILNIQHHVWITHYSSLSISQWHHFNFPWKGKLNDKNLRKINLEFFLFMLLNLVNVCRWAKRKQVTSEFLKFWSRFRLLPGTPRPLSLYMFVWPEQDYQTPEQRERIYNAYQQLLSDRRWSVKDGKPCGLRTGNRNWLVD